MSDRVVESNVMIHNQTIRESPCTTNHEHDNNDSDNDKDVQFERRRPQKSLAIMRIDAMQRGKRATQRNEVKNPVFDRLVDLEKAEQPATEECKTNLPHYSS